MKKKPTIIIGLTVILLISILLSYYFIFVMPKKDVAEKCHGYIPNWTNFIDCYGAIAIKDAWDVEYISIIDHLHQYEVARVYNTNQYTYDNENLYVINRNTIEGKTSDGIRTQYYQRLFQNGEVRVSYYENVSDIPSYLVIDTQSGEVRAFRNISELSQADQRHFRDIENK